MTTQEIMRRAKAAAPAVNTASGEARTRALEYMARELEEPGRACYGPLKEVFGEGILDAEGKIDKKAFAELIFSDEEKRLQANGIIHPAVKEEILRQIEEKKAEGCGLFVVEAALLIEEGYKEILDELWYVYAQEDQRIARLATQRGYTKEKSLSIMRRQLSDIDFRKHCDVIIDNSGALWESEAQIDARMLGTHAFS